LQIAVSAITSTRARQFAKPHPVSSDPYTIVSLIILSPPPLLPTCIHFACCFRSFFRAHFFARHLQAPGATSALSNLASAGISVHARRKCSRQVKREGRRSFFRTTERSAPTLFQPRFPLECCVSTFRLFAVASLSRMCSELYDRYPINGSMMLFRGAARE